MAEQQVWGWTRYERTHWLREDGRKLYIGHFRQDNDPYNWTLVQVKFWAKRPIKALSTICQSGQDPKTFANKTIN